MSLFRPMINLGNSIVGVSILTMPWCFTQCGVVLGTILLVLSAMFTTWTCKMLLRAAHMTRQPTYETLGNAVYGSVGKLGIELANIGLGIGTCVAFYIIIGDLLPPLVAQFLHLDWDPWKLRAVLLVLSAVCVAFPLTLIRNVDRLSAISIGSLAFYLFLIVQLIVSSRANLSWNVVSGVTWWQTMGIFKCLPIFSLAFCCQSQMFVIYTSLREASVRKMSTVVDGAVWMITAAYLSVAMFGYLTFFKVEIQGDILANFPFNSLSQVTRFGFAVTVMLSFPLIVFPCRVSLNSLLCAEGNLELNVTPPIPQGRFTAITAGIMFSTLTLAILIPNIQTVLALVGATLGSLICYIYPGLFLNKVAGSNTEFSSRAKFCIGLGLVVLVVSTMVTLNSWSEEGSASIHYHIKPPEESDIVKLPPIPTQSPEAPLPQQPADKDTIDKEPPDKVKEEGGLPKENVLEVPFNPGENAGLVKVAPADSAKEGNADLLKEPPALEEPDSVKEAEGIQGKLDKETVKEKLENEAVQEKLVELVERVGKLEEENKDLKERQEEIENAKEKVVENVAAKDSKQEVAKQEGNSRDIQLTEHKVPPVKHSDSDHVNKAGGDDKPPQDMPAPHDDGHVERGHDKTPIKKESQVGREEDVHKSRAADQPPARHVENQVPEAGAIIKDELQATVNQMEKNVAIVKQQVTDAPAKPVEVKEKAVEEKLEREDLDIEEKAEGQQQKSSHLGGPRDLKGVHEF